MPDPSTPTNDTSLRTGWAREVRARLSSLRLLPTPETEIVEELSQHLEDRWQEMSAGGASTDEATRLTLAEFRDGDVLARYMTPLQQAHVRPPITPGAPNRFLLGDLWRDLRYAARMLRKQPGFVRSGAGRVAASASTPRSGGRQGALVMEHLAA